MALLWMPPLFQRRTSWKFVCTPLLGHGICCPFWYCGRLKMCESWLSRCNRVVKWCHHGHDFGSYGGPYGHIYNGLAFEAHNRGWRAAHSSPPISPKQGNTALPPSRAWWPQWPWAATVHVRPYSRNSTAWINCVPSNPLQMNGYTHRAVESLRRMTWRSPFQEGEGGVHWGNLLQLQSNQLEEGFPLDHPCNHHVLHW